MCGVIMVCLFSFNALKINISDSVKALIFSFSNTSVPNALIVFFSKPSTIALVSTIFPRAVFIKTICFFAQKKGENLSREIGYVKSVGEDTDKIYLNPEELEKIKKTKGL